MSNTPLAPFAGKIEVVRYSEALRQQWENFMAHSHQGTLFHTRAFLAYHPPERFHDESLLFFKKGKLLAVLPAAIRAHDETRVLCSHPGASFGGFVPARRLSLREYESLVAALVQHGRTQSFVALELALAPLFYHTQPNAELEYALYRAGFRVQRRELTQAVRLDDERELNYSSEFYRKVRRAQTLGVVVKESDDLPVFYDILQHNLAQRHGAQAAHTLHELLDLQQRLPERVRLFAAYVQERMIAGFLVFICNAQAALAFYIAQRYEDQHYRAVNVLTHEVMNWCEKTGFSYFDFGTSTIDAKPNWGLIDFREAAGARGFWRERLRLQLL